MPIKNPTKNTIIPDPIVQFILLIVIVQPLRFDSLLAVVQVLVTEQIVVAVLILVQLQVESIVASKVGGKQK
jgi:hypothetical protein